MYLVRIALARRRRFQRQVLRWAFAVSVAVAACLAQAGSLEEADRAFAQGDHLRALALYEQVLQEDPTNLHALVRSAKLLSWQQRFGEALERYARALELQPGHAEASLERAKVLAWARRFDEARAAFEALLLREPSDREARLGLARTLSWSGRQEEARRQYAELVKANPRDAEALLGVAQTFAWSGALEPARDYYERALEARPGMKEAEVGLAYLDLWGGDRASAARRTRGLAARFPGDRDVQELEQAIARARAFWYRASFDRLDDSEGNEISLPRFEWGVGRGRAEWRAGASRWDMEDALRRDAKVDGLYGILGAHAGTRHYLEARLGVDRREKTTGEEDRGLVGGLTYRLGRVEGWHTRLAAQRDTLRYSTQILDAGIVVDSFEAVLAGRPAPRWRIEIAAGVADFSDDNRRRAAHAGAWHAWRPGTAHVEVGYLARALDFDRDLANGYFDPQDFLAQLLQARAHGAFRQGRGYWELVLEVGLQSFTLSGVEVDRDRVLGGRAALGVPLGGGAVLEFRAGRTDFALQSAAGFESREFGLGLRWQGSGR